MQKILNAIFPIGGGSVGAISQIQELTSHSELSHIVYTIIIATIGAVVGYIMKKLLDFLWLKLKHLKK